MIFTHIEQSVTVKQAKSTLVLIHVKNVFKFSWPSVYGQSILNKPTGTIDPEQIHIVNNIKHTNDLSEIGGSDIINPVKN
jgi:hypothetical protein